MTETDGGGMTPSEIAQHESTAARRGVDTVLLVLVVAVMAVMGLAAAGVV